MRGQREEKREEWKRGVTRMEIKRMGRWKTREKGNGREALRWRERD